MRSLVLLGLALLVVACGPSAEQKVETYLAKRPTAGMLRLVNLTDQPATLHVTKPLSDSTVPGGKDSPFRTVIPGNIHVEIWGAGGKISSEDLAVESKVAMTYVLTDVKSKPQLIKGEVLHTSEPNASVRIAGLEGVTGLTAQIKDAGGKASTAEVAPSSQPQELQSGKYTIEIKDKSGKTVATADLQAEAGMAYTVIVANMGKGITAQPFLNTPHDKPQAAGVSGA